MTETYVCEQLAQSHYVEADGWKSNQRPLDGDSDALITITSSYHITAITGCHL